MEPKQNHQRSVSVGYQRHDDTTTTTTAPGNREHSQSWAAFGVTHSAYERSSSLTLSRLREVSTNIAAFADDAVDELVEEPFSCCTCCCRATPCAERLRAFTNNPRFKAARLIVDPQVWFYMAAATAEVILIKSQDNFTKFPDLPFLVTILLNLYGPVQALLLWRERRRMQRDALVNADAARDVETLKLPWLWWPGVLFGVLSISKTVLKVIGVLAIDGSLYLLLRGTLTFWTMLFAWPILGEVPELSRVLSVLLQFLAIACVLASNDFEEWSIMTEKITDPSSLFAGDDFLHSPIFGVACTLLSTILSSFNDVLADRILAAERYKVEVKRNKRVLKFTVSMYQSLLPLLPCVAFMYLVGFIPGRGDDGDGDDDNEFELIAEAFVTNTTLSAVLFLLFGLGLPVAKGVDRVLKYSVIDSYSAFLFQLVEGFRSAGGLVLVIFLFGEQFRHVIWVVASVACAALAIVVNQGGPYLERTILAKLGCPKDDAFFSISARCRRCCPRWCGGGSDGGSGDGNYVGLETPFESPANL